MEKVVKKVLCHNLDNKEFAVESDKLIFRPSVYGILVENDRVLLSKQWDGYDFPGGGIEIHETIEEALKREFFEETGLHIEPFAPIHCESSFFNPSHSKNHKDEYWNCQLIYYVVKKVGGKLSIANFDEEEKNYADFPEWIDLNNLDNIKFINSISDNVEIIKKTRVGLRC